MELGFLAWGVSLAESLTALTALTRMFAHCWHVGDLEAGSLPALKELQVPLPGSGTWPLMPMFPHCWPVGNLDKAACTP
jgi:hypothetical protein